MSDIHQLKKHLRSCPNSPTEENKTNKMIFKMSSLFIIIPFVKRRETICYLSTKHLGKPKKRFPML